MLIWITGCTQGLGNALTVGLIERGHTLVGCGRNEIALARMNADHPGHTFLPCDVSDDAKVEDFVAKGLLAQGPPDLLINNAAIINETAPLWEIPAEDFEELMDINVSGVANVIRHLAPIMIGEGSGIIANLSSGWGRSTSPGVAPYCASKWAIEGLTRALAEDLPEGLAAIPVNPGIIDTPMLQKTFGTQDATGYWTPEQWAEKAVPFFETLTVEQNGQPLTCPEA